jgi:hypothetical protein
MDCQNQSRNAKRCNCSYPGCPRHALCCECVAYHSGHGELPACYFDAAAERTYDRSVAHYARLHGL